MPIWLELVILSLFTYIAGVAIGWLAWGRSDAANMVTPAEAPGEQAGARDASAETEGEHDS